VGWCWRFRGIQTLLFATTTILAYVLMLVLMTFNVGYCLSVLAGLTLGQAFTLSVRDHVRGNDRKRLLLGTSLSDDPGDCCDG